MVAVKSLLTLLALGAQALAATPSVVCATDLGTKSVKSIPTSTTTTIKKITVVKKIIRKVNVVVVPVAKTTTIRSTSTVTLTSFADEDVDTATETETSEIFTTQAITETTTTTQATTTTITEFTDTTVTTPDTYIPIVTTTYVRYRVKRNEKNAADVHLLSDTSSADPLYPQRVRCVKQVPSYSTKVVSTTVKGPRSTLKAVTKTTLVNIVTTTTTTVFPTDAPTTITVFDLPTITEYLRRVQTRALIQTVTVDNITPRDTIYAACQSNNILLTANRGGRVIGVSGDNAGSPPTVLSGSHTPESCCVECHKLPNCRASLLGKVAGLSSSTKNTCSVFLHADASKCNGAQPVFAEFVTSDNCPAEPQFIWSNGPCGQLVNGGDISVETV